VHDTERKKIVPAVATVDAAGCGPHHCVPIGSNWPRATPTKAMLIFISNNNINDADDDDVTRQTIQTNISLRCSQEYSIRSSSLHISLNHQLDSPSTSIPTTNTTSTTTTTLSYHYLHHLPFTYDKNHSKYPSPFGWHKP
jgi:hypothetical protein